MPTQAQIDEARQCQLEALLAERYPTSVDTDTLRESYPVTMACDWAVLAAAYAARAESDESALPVGQLAWANAVSQNPAYALTDLLFFGYIEAPDPIALPPFAETEALEAVHIEYNWGGMGETVAYTIDLTHANTSPQITGVVNGEDFSAALETDMVQPLGKSLTGLLPVGNHAKIVFCYDNYPDWHVILTYQSGTQVEMTTNGSNIYNFGGPWWVEIDNQLYLQPSATFIIALAAIVEELELPIGQPAAMFCGGLQAPLLDLLFANQP